MTIVSCVPYISAGVGWLVVLTLVAGGFVYALRRRLKASGAVLWWLAGLLGVARIGQTIYMTVAQYDAWLASPLTKDLVVQPLSVHNAQTSLAAWIIKVFHIHAGYFVFYVYGRFWINALLGIGTAFIFLGVLAFLKKYRDRFFDDGELQLGLVAALAVGWPLIVGFVPLVFVGVVVVSFVRLIFFKEKYTTLGWPIFFAAALSLLIAMAYPALVQSFIFLTV